MKIVYAGNDRTRGTYYLYDVKADKLTKIADLAPWIQAEEMAEMIPVSYPSRDGLTIEGYLTLPAGLTMETARQLPVVVNPHGGLGPATAGVTTPRCSSLPTGDMPCCK